MTKNTSYVFSKISRVSFDRHVTGNYSHYLVDEKETMAHQHNPLIDGKGGEQGPPVYRVVQQVAHAKPVTQHRPLFYGK